jgi:hypothetical protein
MIDRDHHCGWTGDQIRRIRGGFGRCGSKIRHGRWTMDEVVHILLRWMDQFVVIFVVCDGWPV